MQEQFLNHINRNRLIEGDSNILLAVSGGVDSMVMLRLFLDAGFNVGVAHCNFQLRGAESEGDDEFVRRTCRELRVPVHIKRFDTETFAEEQGVSIQMAARELRYLWFEELMEEKGYTQVATAHHLGDSAETILLNLTKGSGFEGISGIRVKVGKIIRPMLFASRDNILTYARKNQVYWRDDSSNASRKYQRNFIRNEVIPLLKQLNPNFNETFLDTQERLTQTRIFFQAQLKKVFDEIVSYDGERIMIDKTKVDRLEVATLIIWELLKGYGFNYVQCKDIVGRAHQTGKTFVSGTHQLSIDREFFVLSKISEVPAFEFVIHENDREVQSSFSVLNISISEAGGEIDPAPNVAQLDRDKIQFPLTWRTWRSGDSFVPLGMSMPKKVSDFLIDAKVSMADKVNVSVVTDKSGSILWLVGHRIDDRYKITGSTRNILKLSAVGSS